MKGENQIKRASQKKQLILQEFAAVKRHRLTAVFLCFTTVLLAALLAV
jgi:hypothetical protein